MQSHGTSGEGGNSKSGGNADSGGDAAGVHRFKTTIPSDFVESRRLQDEIMAAVAEVGFTDDDVFAIRLALEEAMINAIKHGNKHAADKVVRVEATVSAESLEVIIEDEGAGFDRASVPDPLADENLEKNSGRGILLIESYMDSAEWTNGGRRLRMAKKRVPAAVAH